MRFSLMFLQCIFSTMNIEKTEKLRTYREME